MLLLNIRQHVGFIWPFCQPGGLVHFFSAWGERKKLLGCGLLGGSAPRLTLWFLNARHNPWKILTAESIFGKVAGYKLKALRNLTHIHVVTCQSSEWLLLEIKAHKCVQLKPRQCTQVCTPTLEAAAVFRWWDIWHLQTLQNRDSSTAPIASWCHYCWLLLCCNYCKSLMLWITPRWTH